MPTSSLLLLLADGRFPAGAHAHSGGLEAAVAAGRVTDLASLEAFLVGRLATAGLVGAAFAAAAHRAAVTPASVGPGARPVGLGHPARRATTPTDPGVRPAVAADSAVRGEAPADASPCRNALARLDAELDARTASPALRGCPAARAGPCCVPDGPSGRLARSTICPRHRRERTSRWCSGCSAPPPA
ncbi:hypothetical protein [Micromonospora sp. CA-248212]|uniref:hypothetical protein n=1 Tax=Micromonospora sp. CA-248212 TaxID=3239961 RepID=UPI003D8C13C5